MASAIAPGARKARVALFKALKAWWIRRRLRKLHVRKRNEERRRGLSGGLDSSAYGDEKRRVSWASGLLDEDGTASLSMSDKHKVVEPTAGRRRPTQPPTQTNPSQPPQRRPSMDSVDSADHFSDTVGRLRRSTTERTDRPSRLRT